MQEEDESGTLPSIKAARQLRFLVSLTSPAGPIHSLPYYYPQTTEIAASRGETVTTVLLLAKLWEELTRWPSPRPPLLCPQARLLLGQRPHGAGRRERQG